MEGAKIPEDPASQALKHWLVRLIALAYIQLHADGLQPGLPRTVKANGKLGCNTVFRGSFQGVEVGASLSQFLLIGNPARSGVGDVQQGRIRDAAPDLSQKVPIAEPEMNCMLTNIQDQRRDVALQSQVRHATSAQS